MNRVLVIAFMAVALISLVSCKRADETVSVKPEDSVAESRAGEAQASAAEDVGAVLNDGGERVDSVAADMDRPDLALQEDTENGHYIAPDADDVVSGTFQESALTGNLDGELSENMGKIGVFLVEKEVSPELAHPKADRHVSLVLEDTQKSSTWLNVDVWVKKHHFEKPKLPYEKGGYRFSGDAEAEFGYMYSAVHVTSPDQTQNIYDFYNYTISFQKNKAYPFLKFVAIQNNIYYASFSHNEYTDVNPNTGFMIAFNGEGKVLWRSQNQICNSQNFLIVGDTIICGYGFTNEPNFIYLLDVNTGDVVDKVSIKTSPEYFWMRDGSLYVLTYDAEYRYRLDGELGTMIGGQMEGDERGLL
ncbi:MAG: hypothetical protein IJ165_00045 [Proteobacteria bacterium]|nr:hypothetical protein [Pseudomonadota bacterium]